MIITDNKQWFNNNGGHATQIRKPEKTPLGLTETMEK
jgi:hypothetical protein